MTTPLTDEEIAARHKQGVRRTVKILAVAVVVIFLLTFLQAALA